MAIVLSKNTLLPWMTSDVLSSFYIAISVAAIMSVILILSQWVFKPLNQKKLATRSPDGSPPELRWPVAQIAYSFFTTQFDFLTEAFKTTRSEVFRFQLLKNEVIALSGDEARRMFFREKSLNLYQGFQVLIGTVRDRIPI